MKTTTKLLSSALLVFLTISGVMAYNHITSEEVYLKNKIGEANQEQEQLKKANDNLREIMPKREKAYEKAHRELQDLELNIRANSDKWALIDEMKNIDQVRLDMILEVKKDIGEAKKTLGKAQE